MVRLSNLPVTRVWRQAKEAAKSGGRDLHRAHLQPRHVDRTADSGFPPLATMPLCNTIICNGLQSITLRGEVAGCSEPSRSLKRDMVPLVTVDYWIDYNLLV
jgi:hypothetical protein